MYPVHGPCVAALAAPGFHQADSQRAAPFACRLCQTLGVAVPTLATTWTLIAIAVSATALLIAYLNFRRKSSISLRGGYTLISSLECEDGYVSNVVLENMKDRAVTIYSIHLLVGHNFLIKLEEFDENPLILRPFETISREYGPIEFYAVNGRRLHMSKVLRDKRAARRLVLSSSQGRYVVRRFPKRWQPVQDHFRNRSLALVSPVRTTYKHKSIGGRIRYVVDMASEDGKDEIVMLREEDWGTQIFRNFILTKESLESPDSITEFLNERQTDGKLTCKSFTVLDARAWREKERSSYTEESRQAEFVGYLKFKIAGRLLTIAQDLALRRKNARLRKSRQLESDDA